MNNKTSASCFKLLIFSLLLSIHPACRQSNTEIQNPKDGPNETLSCQTLPSQFHTYEEAKDAVTNANFKITDHINTSKSSWITHASYYSCDVQTGYFLMGTTKKDYLFVGMPYDVWNEFKRAESFGKFYHQYIKGRYILYLAN